MEARNMTQKELEKKSGVSQRQISNILNKQTGCGVEAADALARVFNLNGWHLLIPDLPNELLTSPTLVKLVDAYTHASGEGREMILRVAEREATYGRVIDEGDLPSKR
jgi:transcriptional regulator with XRE-family HTH domain